MINIYLSYDNDKGGKYIISIKWRLQRGQHIILINGILNSSVYVRNLFQFLIKKATLLYKTKLNTSKQNKTHETKCQSVLFQSKSVYSSCKFVFISSRTFFEIVRFTPPCVHCPSPSDNVFVCAFCGRLTNPILFKPVRYAHVRSETTTKPGISFPQSTTLEYGTLHTYFITLVPVVGFYVVVCCCWCLSFKQLRQLAIVLSWGSKVWLMFLERILQVSDLSPLLRRISLLVSGLCHLHVWCRAVDLFISGGNLSFLLWGEGERESRATLNRLEHASRISCTCKISYCACIIYVYTLCINVHALCVCVHTMLCMYMCTFFV